MSYYDHQKWNPSTLLPPFKESASRSRTPSESTIRTEKTTKSKKGWKLPRMASDGKLRATLTRMTSLGKKNVKKDVPAVPELPKQPKAKSNGNRQLSIAPQETQSSRLLDGKACLKNKYDDNVILKPPVPAFMGSSKKRNSSHSSLTSNSESGSEFGSERSFSAYSMSTVNSPLYVKSGSSSQSHCNVILDYDPEEVAKFTNGDTTKSSGRPLHNQEIQNTSFTSSAPFSPSAQLARDTHPIASNVVRSSTFALPKKIRKNPQRDLYALNAENKTLHEIQTPKIFYAKTTPDPQESRSPSKHQKTSLQNNTYFIRPCDGKAENSNCLRNPIFHHTHLAYANHSDGQSVREDSTSKPLPYTVMNVSPRQSPMVSPGTLLPLTLPFSPLRSSGGLTTSGRKALYTCTIRKLYPQLPRLDARGPDSSPIVSLKFPRSMNNVRTLQMHTSTTSHFRNLAVLLARTKITIRLRNSVLTKEEEEEIKKFVGKGYLKTYICPQEVACRTQKVNNYVQADTLTKSPLHALSAKTVNENGMTAWIQRKTFVQRMKMICSMQEDEESKSIPQIIEADLFPGLQFSQRNQILGFGDGIERQKASITPAKEATISKTGVHQEINLDSNPSSSVSKESFLFLDEDDVPLALLKKKRSKSSTRQNRVNIDRNETTKRLNGNEQYLFEARSRRNQSDQHCHDHLTSQTPIHKSKASHTKVQVLQNKREDAVNASLFSCEPVEHEVGLSTENKGRNAKYSTLERRTMFIPAMQSVAMVTPQPMLMTHWSDPVQVPVLYGVQSAPTHRVFYPLPFAVQTEPPLTGASNNFPDVHREAHRFSNRGTPKRSPLSQNVFNA